MVKVQHVGVERRMATDILILEQLLVGMKKLEPDYDLTPIARQWMTAIPEELDFVREAENMRTLSGLLAARHAPLTADNTFGNP